MTRQFFQTVSMAAAIALGASAAIGSFSQPSYANFPDTGFICTGPSSSILSAQSTTTSKTVALIDFRAGGGFNSQDRCEFARKNFNDANAKSSVPADLAYITTGVKNGQTILCSVPNYGNDCDSPGNFYLFTLSNRTVNTQEALRRLFFRLHTGKTTEPVLRDSESRIYIDMKEYIRAAFAEEGGSADSSQR